MKASKMRETTVKLNEGHFVTRSEFLLKKRKCVLSKGFLLFFQYFLLALNILIFGVCNVKVLRKLQFCSRAKQPVLFK